MNRGLAGCRRGGGAACAIAAAAVFSLVLGGVAAAATSPAPSPAASPLAAQAPAPSVSSGAAVFGQNCSGCHGTVGQGGVSVPSLPYPPPPLAPAGFPSLVSGMVQQGGLQMPSFARALTTAQIQAVAGYVSQQLAAPEARTADSSSGGVIFRLYCAGCHSTTGRGGAMARGRNAPNIALYPPAEALAAMIFGRGDMPVFAGSALDVRQQTSVALYVEMLHDPPSPGGRGLGYLGPVPEGAVGAAALLILIFVAVWLAWKSRRAVA
jgi:ubiquinol-cytochrome c reductase cytochrome c subunit